MELLRIQIHDQKDPSASLMDPEPKRTKTTTVADTENLADRMDEDNFPHDPLASACDFSQPGNISDARAVIRDSNISVFLP